MLEGRTSVREDCSVRLCWALLTVASVLGACAAPEHDRPAKVRVPPALSASSEAASQGDVAPAPLSELEDRAIDWSLNPTMHTLGRMAATLTNSVYSHGIQVDERNGVYSFDCSGMAMWVLRKASPKAARSLARASAGRPLARDFQRRIASISPDHPRDGWRRVMRVQDAVAGDVVAWLKPSVLNSPNTGHVAFIVLPPQPVPHYDNAFLVRVADSSSLLHDRDTRVGRNGFGFGTILLVTDPETGSPQAYGWVGLRYRAFETDIVIGRPVE